MPGALKEGANNMPVIIKDISVDVSQLNVFQAIVAKQYDSNSRFLRVTITDQGAKMPVPAGAAITINARRKDNQSKAFAGTVNGDGTVTVPLASWMLALDDTVECDISIVDQDSKKLTTTTFAVNVEHAAYSGTDISPDDNPDFYVQLLSAVADAKTEAHKATVEVEELKDYIGYTDVIGLEVDYENKTTKRLGAAKTLAPGAGFNQFRMFGGRRRCNVADNGTITAYYGDPGYREDGSNSQVMVYQPAFYYRADPIKLEKITGGIGYHTRKARYYVSDNPKPDFKLHPAFFDSYGNPVDYILLSAYEGCIYDTSATAYILNDAQVMDVAADKLSSISGAKPASGLTQQLTRPNVERLARNRGEGWHCNTIKTVSVNQLLMMIELGTLNTQSAIENGVVSITDNSSYNCASLTGSTASLGNATGAATETINDINGVKTTYNTPGKRSISYRGAENPWGNMWEFVDGINIFSDATTGEHQAYICSDFNFAESKKTENYIATGFTLPKTNGYISAMGHSADFDWLFLPSEVSGTSSAPVGDYYYQSAQTSGYKVAPLGGNYNSSNYGGAFSWAAHNVVGIYYRNMGGRLVYVPTSAQNKSSDHLERLLSQHADQPYHTASGESLHITDSAGGRIKSVIITGKCAQDAAPNPDAPQQIKTVQGPLAINISGTGQIGVKTFSIPLTDASKAPIVLSELDKITIRDGVWGAEKNMKKEDLTNASFDRTPFGSNYARYKRSNNATINAKSLARCYCTHFVSAADSNGEYDHIYHNQSGDLEIISNKWASTNDFERWLDARYESGASLTIYYELASSLWIPLSPESQAALNALVGVSLPAGIANISTSNIPAPSFEVVYRQDLKAWVIGIVQELQNAVVALGGV